MIVVSMSILLATVARNVLYRRTNLHTVEHCLRGWLRINEPLARLIVLVV